MFKILVTGVAGTLGRQLAQQLRAADFAVVGLDVAPPRVPLDGIEFVQADLCDRAALDETLASLGAIQVAVHCAALHPWKKYSDDQYLDSNIKGTWHLYSAAAKAGIAKFVLTSSIAAAGYHAPLERWPVREEESFDLHDLYSLTKKTQEETARIFAAQGAIQTLALRPPMFVPQDELHTGFCLTVQFAQVPDIVSAHVAGVRVLTGDHQPPRASAMFEAITIANQLPYSADDLALLGPDNNVLPLAQKYFPEATAWLQERGYEGLPLGALYDLTKARELLDWQPRHNFQQWWSARSQEKQ